MQDLLDYNSNLVKLYCTKSKLYNKYKTSINLYGHFSRFFFIADQCNYSIEQVEEYLKNANDEIAYIYCSALAQAKNNILYCKYFPIMLYKLSNNLEYLYRCLFKDNYWHLTGRVLFYNPNCHYQVMDKADHLFLLEDHLENIFNRWGYELYKKCRRGYNIMLTFFILFQEFFTDEMIETFINSMHKKICNNSNKESIIAYLNSPYIRIKMNNKWQALQLLMKL